MICEKLIEIFRKKIKAGFRAAALGEGVASNSVRARGRLPPKMKEKLKWKEAYYTYASGKKLNL